MKTKQNISEKIFNPDFDASDEPTTSDMLKVLERFYDAKLKPLGDHAPRKNIAGTIEITHEEKTAVFWIVCKMREIQNARSKGGKANKKFASDKERYAFHNAKRKKVKDENK